MNFQTYFLNLKKFLKKLKNKFGNPSKTKECYWLLQGAKYFKAWGFWRKNNKKTKKNYYMSAALAS